jgi:hypothetical protein
MMLLRHRKNYFGVRKDQMYVNGKLKDVFSLAFFKLRFYLM